jgi:hypothetical protein
MDRVAQAWLVTPVGYDFVDYAGDKGDGVSVCARDLNLPANNNLPLCSFSSVAELYRE